MKKVKNESELEQEGWFYGSSSYLDNTGFPVLYVKTQNKDGIELRIEY